MIELDGSIGEGGGQILRSALALSLVTGQAFHLRRIRAGRKKPGLLRQHLTAVRAATRIGNAFAEGAELGSLELSFRPPSPARPEAGHYEFAIGTAGSTSLVLQAVLPALWFATRPTEIVLRGGTHNPAAPPFEFLERVFLPLIRTAGVGAHVHLVRAGFFPAGGGEVRCSIEPNTTRLRPLELRERGALVAATATAVVANLPSNIAHRELKVLASAFDLPRDRLHVRELHDVAGGGNVLFLELEFEHARELLVGFGERSKRAERVAEELAETAQRFLEADVPVGEHLADQLLLPLALAGGGAFRTLTPTAHTRTNALVIERFLPVRIDILEQAGTAEVSIHAGADP